MNEIIIRVDPKSSEDMYELDKNFREFKRLEGVTSIRKATRERITLERETAKDKVCNLILPIAKKVLGDKVSIGRSFCNWYAPYANPDKSGYIDCGIGITVNINVDN